MVSLWARRNPKAKHPAPIRRAVKTLKRDMGMPIMNAGTAIDGSAGLVSDLGPGGEEAKRKEGRRSAVRISKVFDSEVGPLNFRVWVG